MTKISIFTIVFLHILSFLKISGEKESYKKILSEVEKYINHPVYVPAERVLIPIISNITLNLIQNNVPLPKILLNYGALFEKARESLKNQNVDFLNIKYIFKGNEIFEE